MTRDEASAIRASQLSGQPVDPALAAEALGAIKSGQFDPPARPPKPPRRRRWNGVFLLKMDADERARVNAILIENFKHALGRDFTGMKQEGTQ